MKAYMVRGVPQKLQQDGWWFSPPPPETNTAKTGDKSGGDHVVRLAVLVALIAIGDMLFWDTVPGLSLAVFAGICIAAGAVLLGKRVKPRNGVLAAGLTVLAVLPVAELVQPLSLVFFFAGLPIAAAILAGSGPWRVFQLWFLGFSGRLKTWRFVANSVRTTSLRSGTRAASLRWGLPLGVGCLFAALLIQANPVLGLWLDGLVQSGLVLPAPERVLLWAGLWFLCWPVVALSAAIIPAARTFSSKQGPMWLPAIINAPAIGRSLVIFNALFAVQNGMDFAVLAGGAKLPEGVTYAQYAHQGAYPLIALALMSGLFALIARPFVPATPWLKPLLMIWIAQTIWLCWSSVLRLDLYVGTYGLTRLRMAAEIWMWLVAGGLGLILWQVGRMRDSGWLLKRLAIMGTVTLYACCFVSFDARIARYNLSHDVPLDRFYICSLGEAAVPEIRAAGAVRTSRYCSELPIYPWVTTPSDWREWGFRNARVRHKLDQLFTASKAQP